MHVSPARRGSLLTADEVRLFCSDLAQVMPLYVKDYHPEHPCRLPLLRAGVSSLMRFPLRAGEDLLATMLLLDLPGADRIAETEKIITHLTPVMALALKNSFASEEIERQAKKLAYYAGDLERRVAQRTDALRESEEKYRALVENAQEAILIAQEGLLKYVNRAAVDLFGASFETLTSTPFTEFVHPEDRDAVMSYHRRQLSG